MLPRILLLLMSFCLGWILISPVSVSAQSKLVEAESFDQLGGWKLDTQFIEIMGSPYLLAHGLGQPVDDAKTQLKFDELGEYHVYVRTKDWVAPWQAEGQPGRFQLVVNGKTLDTAFGTNGPDWDWQYGGTVAIDDPEVELVMRDLTGFDGRCDAIYFTRENRAPANDSEILPAWRRQQLGLAATPKLLSEYDLVVIGGGYSGMGTALSAARMGCRVALLQNRPVLGGNGSSEVRVWSMGLIRRGRFPRVGEIVEEFCDNATKSPGTYEEFEDAKKLEIIQAEKNIDLFLNHHAYAVKTEGKRISSVTAFDTRTSQHTEFAAPLFADCTGHGTIGYLADADWDMTPQERMGMSNMWAWAESKSPQSYPETAWALPLEMKDFPYPRDFHGQWFWESGFDKDPIREAELIRDWNLRAVYGAFNAMKNGDGAKDHANAYLTWVAYIGGPRESRRLLGDVILTQEDIVSKREFKDGCVPSTWSIDLHYPKRQYAEKFSDNPFISIAKHDRRIDRSFGYPVPYRSFYSRNIENLFMAGRCISVTHEALGTTRVMKTCGMMGEVVGRAASICTLHQCLPRDVYSDYWPEMEELLELPGKARRPTVQAPILIPEDAFTKAGPNGPVTGIDPAKLDGIILDDLEAEKVGSWTVGTGLKGYVGWNYLYAQADSNSSIVFQTADLEEGKYEVRIAYREHANRGPKVPITISVNKIETKLVVNMQQPPASDGFITLGRFDLGTSGKLRVTMSCQEAGGFVHADAVQVLRVNE